MGNISSTVLSHSKNILIPVSNGEHGCNCRSKESCPLQNKCLIPKIVYQADIMNLKNDEKGFTLELQKHPLNNVLVTTLRTSNTPNTEIAPSYQNMNGNSKIRMYGSSKPHVSPVVERNIFTKVLSKTQLNFCKLCLCEKFYLMKSLNDPN